MGKQEQTHNKFRVFVCYNKEDCEKASILEHMLEEKGFVVYMANSESYDNFISDEITDMIGLSICFIAIFTSNFVNSSLINQEIGYAQGKGLRVILIINDKLKDETEHKDQTNCNGIQ